MKTVMESIKGKQYSAYKDSYQQWLGDIPKHWEILPSKRFHQVKKQPNSKRECDNVLSLTLRGVVNNDPESPEGMVPKDYGTYQIFEKGNLVFKLIDLENVKTSRVGIVHEKGIMSSAYIRLVIGEGNFPRFTYYYFYCLYINQVYNNLGSGVRSTLGPTDLLNIPYLKPPFLEQTAIAAFLDRKTALIGQAIDIKQKQIELLKERRQIMIHNAVTRGINPDVKLKESGIEWINEIPEHWEVRRSKFLFEQRKERARDGDVQLSATQAYGVIPQEEYESKIERRVVKIQLHLEKRKHVEVDDFVISMRSFQGGLERAWSSGCIRSSYVILKPLEKIDATYYSYLLKSSTYIKALQSTASFIRDGQDLNFENFAMVDLFIPPLKEQKEIANYIGSNLKLIDRANELQTAHIEKLEEYKATLIDSVVTGKIKVN